MSTDDERRHDALAACPESRDTVAASVLAVADVPLLAGWPRQAQAPTGASPTDIDDGASAAVAADVAEVKTVVDRAAGPWHAVRELSAVANFVSVACGSSNHVAFHVHGGAASQCSA
jgi:hypothetical protein